MEKSFFKWSGEKYLLLPKIISLLNSFEDRNVKQTLVEPFLGSGTIFLNFNKVNDFILNDSNKDLINIFNLLKENQDFIENSSYYFKSINNDYDYFNKIVAQFNKVANIEQRAQMLIYLNKHCANALIKFDKSGYFNTSFGHNKVVVFPKKSLEITKTKILNNNVLLLNRNFEVILRNSGFGDIVYCESPYLCVYNQLISKENGNFFSLENQKFLTQMIWEAAQRGAKVLLHSNVTELTKNLYKNCSSYEIIDFKNLFSKNKAPKDIKIVLAVYDF